MKIRNGYVSNSSSSSFFIKFKQQSLQHFLDCFGDFVQLIKKIDSSLNDLKFDDNDFKIHSYQQIKDLYNKNFFIFQTSKEQLQKEIDIKLNKIFEVDQQYVVYTIDSERYPNEKRIMDLFVDIWNDEYLNDDVRFVCIERWS